MDVTRTFFVRTVIVRSRKWLVKETGVQDLIPDSIGIFSLLQSGSGARRVSASHLLGVERPECEASSSPEVKDMWNSSYTPSYISLAY